MNRKTLRIVLAALLLAPVAVGIAGAEEVVKSFDFEVDRWYPIEVSDGPVTLHRIRIDRKEDRLNKATLARPYNQQYLQPVRFELDYTNGSSEKWKARVMVRWLDEEDRVIDGFSANETLQKKSAHKTVHASVSTLKYGIERAKTLQVEVRFEP